MNKCPFYLNKKCVYRPFICFDIKNCKEYQFLKNNEKSLKDLFSSTYLKRLLEK